MNLKKRLFFPVFMLFLYGSAQIPPTIQWQQNFGGSDMDFSYSVRPTSDGGYILAGSAQSDDGDFNQSYDIFGDVWIVKLDSNGNLVWKNIYGGSLDDRAYDIQQTSDGGYVVAGASFSSDIDVSNNNGKADVWVFKLDAMGNLIWEKTYGGSQNEYAYAIQQTVYGEYIVAGITSSNDGDVGSYIGGLTDAWVLKLNANGNLLWENTYGGGLIDEVSNIVQINDGSYVVAGHTQSTDGDIPLNKGFWDIWVFKLFPNGTLNWSKTYGGSGRDEFNFGLSVGRGNDALQQTNDGGYILAASTWSVDGDISSPAMGASDSWILKLDSFGNLLWEKTYGGTVDEMGGTIQETLDGNYIAGYYTRSDDGDVGQLQGIFRTDYWVFKIDPVGNLLWEQTYGGSHDDALSALQQVSDCEYIMTGHIRSNDGDVSGNNGDYDWWVVKLQMQWPPPTVNSPQNFCWSDNAVLADIPVSGDPQPGFQPVFTWYDDALKTNILPDTTVLTDGENYFVSQTIDGCESPLAEVIVNVTPDTPPTAASPQAFCLDDMPEISDIAITGQNLLWYQGPNANTQIPANTNLEDGKTYYVSQTTNSCESSLLPIAVEVFPPPAVFPVPDVVACDTDGNGEGEFYLPDLDNTVSGGAANVTVSYHASLPDAENGTNALPDNHIIQNSPQSIYARVLDNTTGCDSTMEIQLVFSAVPEIMGLEDLTGCDNGNGQAVFDLTENNTNILGNQNTQNLKITYHHNQTEAENGQNPIPDPENHQSGPGDVFVRLENTQTGCFDTGSFKISVLPRPDIADISIQEEFCSDLPGGDFATIDLTVYDQQINPNAPANTEVVYYENLNAYNANKPIENPGSYTTTANPQILIAETTNTETGCPSLVFVEIEININDRPVVDIGQYDGKAICWDSNLSTPVHGGNYQAIVLNTGLGENEYGFAWTLNGEVLPTTGPSLEAVEPGEYEVVVSDTDGVFTTCTATSKAIIVEANPPEFRLSRTSGFVASEHGILVSEVSGIGNFEFRLDDGNWVSLEGGRLLFENVAPGTHSVYGRSLEGCGTTIKTITLIGYPKFFTPNNDGSNDRWNIIGLQEGKVYIFDRYGKLLASLDPQRQGWNGTYNGKPMPSDDYWFKVEFVEKLPDGSERSGEFKANFSLIR